MHQFSAARPKLAWLASLVLALAAAVLLTAPGAAQAATKVNGKAAFTLGTGKAGKVLKKQKVRIRRVAPATAKALAGKRARVTAPVNAVANNGKRVALRGGFTFRRGKRAAAAHGLTVVVAKKAISVNARLAGKKVRLFRGAGRVNSSTGKTVTVKVRNGNLRLTPQAARLIKRQLKVKRVPAAAYGKLNLNARKVTTTKPVDPVDPCVENPDAEGCPIVDPYLEQCGVTADSKVPGALAPAAPLPVLADPKPLAGSDDLAWGFKESFRSYVSFVGGGGLHAADGAGRDGAGPLAGFTFPVADGQYAANDPVDTTDDQAIINGKGTSIYCATGHDFRIVIKDPTVVIDGANSRIVADIDMNMTGVWTPAQRVDLATLDLEGISPFYNRSGSEVSWGDVPAELTAEGRQAFCRPSSGPGLPETCLYEEGEDLDPINVSLRTAYDAGEGEAGLDSLATYVKDQLHFPLADRTIGGCELPEAGGGSTGAARTFEDYQYWNSQATTPADPPAYQWIHDGDQPAALPVITDGTPLTGGQLDWGVRQGLRSSTYANGEFNIAGGAEASHPYYGYGEGGTLPATPFNQYNTALGGATGFFTWPAADSAGVYDEATGRAILRTTGRVAICNTRFQAPFLMAYGTVLSNPTVVIDGADSRITVDVATRYRLSWVRGTVDVVKFDAADALDSTPVPGGGETTVTWEFPPAVLTPPPGSGAATMTKAGEAVLNMLGNTTYVEGVAMDSPTITATFAE